MPRKFFKRFMPNPDRVHSNKLLRMFGKVLHDPNLWHLNRRSVSRAMAVGLFWTVVPMPFQMIPGTACAIVCRANVGLSLVLIWITNPITFPPILYLCYKFGRLLLAMPPSEGQFAFTLESIKEHMSEIWRPLYVGALSVGAAMAVLGYFGTQVMWHWHVGSRWRRRALARQGQI